MKKIPISLFFLLILGFSCTQDDPPTPPDPAVEKYMSLSANSTWSYEVIDNETSTTSGFIVSSTDRDSTINGKSYHVFTNTGSGGNEYYHIATNEYLNFRKLPANFGGSSVENIYLKDNVTTGTSWPQSYNITLSGFPANVTLTNAVAEKGLVKVVNNITYNDVIKVTTAIAVTVSGIPLPASAITADIQSFYAPKVGMIQSIYKIDVDFSGIVEHTDQLTNLKTSDIK